LPYLHASITLIPSALPPPASTTTHGGVPPATSWTRMAGDLLAAADRYQRWWRG